MDTRGSVNVISFQLFSWLTVYLVSLYSWMFCLALPFTTDMVVQWSLAPIISSHNFRQSYVVPTKIVSFCARSVARKSTLAAWVVSGYGFKVACLSLRVNMFHCMMKKASLYGCCLDNHIKLAFSGFVCYSCRHLILAELFCCLILGLTPIHNLILKGPWNSF